MKKCEKCGVKFDERLEACPICAEKSEKPKENENIMRANEYAYPILRRRKKPPLDAVQIYTLTALIAVIAAGIANAFIFKDVLWSGTVAIAAVFGGFTVVCISGSINFTAKVLYELAAAIFAVYLTTFVFDGAGWFVPYALPVLFMLATATQFGLMLFTHRRYRMHYISTALMSALGFIPLLVSHLTDSNMIASYISAGVSALAIIVSLSLGNKNLLTEFKGRFNI